MYLSIYCVPFPFLQQQTSFPVVPLAGRREGSFLVKMAAPLTLLLIVAVTIRAALFRSSLADLISERVEVVSPLTAWKRGKRGFSGFLGPFFRLKRGSGCLLSSMLLTGSQERKVGNRFSRKNTALRWINPHLDSSLTLY